MGIHHGEYYEGNFGDDGSYRTVDYQESLNFQETDEEYLLYLKQKRQKEIEAQRRKEEQERKKLWKSTRKSLLSADDNDDNQNNEVRSNPEIDDPNKINPFEDINIPTLEGL